MGDFFSHPLRLLLVGGSLCLLAVTGAVVLRDDVSPEGTGKTWGSIGAFINPEGYGEARTKTSLYDDYALEIRAAQEEHAGSFVFTPSGKSSEWNESPDSFDFAAFLEALSGSAPVAESPSTDTAGLLQNLYTFIPRGLISIETPPEKTALQEELFAYGNRFGSIVGGFEDSHQDSIEILRDQAEDRGNAEKAAKALRYAEDLEALGRELESMSDVPARALLFHSRLAKSYTEAGQKLADIPRAGSETAFMTAVEKYNASMDVFIRNYVALVEFFVAQKVSFGPGDPGNIFSFTAASSFGL